MVLHYRNEDRRGVYAELELYHGAEASAAVGCGSAWGSTTGRTIGGSGTEVGAGTGAGVGGLGGGGSTSAKTLEGTVPSVHALLPTGPSASNLGYHFQAQVEPEG